MQPATHSSEHGRHRKRSWLAWLAIAFGALWAISNAQDIATVAQTRQWPTTSGTIVESHLGSERMATSGRFAGRSITVGRLHLTYIYDVAGSRYTGSRWNALPPSANQATHAMLRQYPPGGGVVVHYDPHNPSSAVLDTSWPILKYVQVAVGLLLMGVVWTATGRRRVTA